MAKFVAYLTEASPLAPTDEPGAGIGVRVFRDGDYFQAFSVRVTTLGLVKAGEPVEDIHNLAEEKAAQLARSAEPAIRQRLNDRDLPTAPPTKAVVVSADTAQARHLRPELGPNRELFEFTLDDES